MRILSLGPESYGGFAGIAQGTRDFLDGLLSSDHVDCIDHLARRVPDGGPDLPLQVRERYAGGSPWNLAREAFATATGAHGLIFCLHVNLMPVAALLKQYYGLPIWLAIHGIDAWQPPRSRARRWSIGAADFVTSSSRYTRERYLDWAPTPADAVVVNNNPVHLEHWDDGPKPAHLLERYGLGGRRVLLTLGRMLGGDRLKGHDEILAVLPELLQLHPNLVWLIVGEGPDRARIEAETERRGLSERVVFAGRIGDEERQDYYRLADAYALPSRTEGFGIAYLEAVACGLPALGSRLDGSRDALADGALGVLVDPGNRRELLGGLDTILRARRATPKQIRTFSFEAMAERMRAMLVERFEPRFDRKVKGAA